MRKLINAFLRFSGRCEKMPSDSRSPKNTSNRERLEEMFEANGAEEILPSVISKRVKGSMVAKEFVPISAIKEVEQEMAKGKSGITGAQILSGGKVALFMSRAGNPRTARIVETKGNEVVLMRGKSHFKRLIVV